MNKGNLNIGVFLSANDVPQIYENATLELVKLIAIRKFTFVYGGTEKGLMKKAADETRKYDGKIISVAAEEFRKGQRKDVDELIECPNIPDRKKKFLEVSDAIISLPGGTGTLDEFTEIMETKKWGGHNKPLALLNTDNFWGGLIQQFERMQKEGFLGKPVEELIYITEKPEEAINYIVKALKK